MSCLIICISVFFYDSKNLEKEISRYNISDLFCHLWNHLLRYGRGLHGKGEGKIPPFQSDKLHTFGEIFAAQRFIDDNRMSILFEAASMRRERVPSRSSRLDLNAYARTLVALCIHALVCVLLE